MKTNKSIILEVFREIFAQQNEAAVHRLVKDHYIQHNPLVKDGKQGFLEFIAYLRQLPKTQTTTRPLMRLLEEKDLVVVHTALPFAGKLNVVMELYRLENGQLAEHWDVVQVQEPGTVSLADGPVDIQDLDQTAANKSLVRDFFETVFVHHRIEKTGDHVHPDLIQHHTALGNGKESLEKYLHAQNFTWTIHRVVAEGNMVYVQAEKKNANTAFACSFIFRLAQGKIVEQWYVEQEVPAVMMHGNGMI